MFEESQTNLFESIAGELMPSSAESHVSLSALPESEKEMPMIVGSGASSCVWCLKSNPCGCWRRILAESLVLALIDYHSDSGFRIGSRLLATNSCPSIWLLKMLGRPIKESACSLWRSPTAVESGARIETLFTKDGKPATTGRRAYRLQPDGRLVLQSVTLGQQLKMHGRADLAVSPTFREQLMGFPIGWTEITHSETLSSHKSPK